MAAWQSWFWDAVLLDCCTRTDFNTLKPSVLFHPSKQKASLVCFFFLKDMQLAYDILILFLLQYFFPKFAPFLQAIKGFRIFHLKKPTKPKNKQANKQETNSLPTRNFHLHSQTEFLECSFSYSWSCRCHRALWLPVYPPEVLRGRDSFLSILASPWLSRVPGIRWVLHEKWRAVF